MVNWNMVLGVAVPLLLAVFTVLATMIPIVLHFKDKTRGVSICTEVEMNRPQPGDGPLEFSIIGSVNSNNDSPCLSVTLERLFERMNELEIELNIDPRGCASIG